MIWKLKLVLKLLINNSIKTIEMNEYDKTVSIYSTISSINDLNSDQKTNLWAKALAITVKTKNLSEYGLRAELSSLSS